LLNDKETLPSASPSEVAFSTNLVEHWVCVASKDGQSLQSSFVSLGSPGHSAILHSIPGEENAVLAAAELDVVVEEREPLVVGEREPGAVVVDKLCFAPDSAGAVVVVGGAEEEVEAQAHTAFPELELPSFAVAKVVPIPGLDASAVGVEMFAWLFSFLAIVYFLY